MVLVLTGVAVIMGGILAYVNHLTEGPINDQKAKALADGIKTVMCVSDITVAKTDTVSPAEPLTVSKDGGQVDAITASTITSRAFLLAVNNAYNAYKVAPVADAETGATKQVKKEE